MPFLVVVLIVVIVGIAVAASKKADAAWSEAADRLGLSYTAGGFFQSRVMTGRVDRLRVKIDTFTRSSGKNSSRYTRFRVEFRSVGMGLELSREGVLSGVARFFGAQDIEVGDADFDPRVTVKGRDPEAVRRFLTPARRLRITNLLGRYDAKIDHCSIEIVVSGLVSDPSRLVTVCNQAVLTGRELTSDDDEPSTLDRVFRAGHEGHLDDALAIAHERPAEDLDLAEVEASLLLTSGKTEEAAVVLRELARAEPEPAASVEGKEPEPPTPATVEESDATEDLSPIAPAAPEPKPEVERGPDLETFCAEMFVAGRMSFETNRLFTERWEGAEILWRGTVERVEPFSFDLALGSGPALRAVLVVGEVQESGYSRQQVRCMLRLPSDAEATWRELRGREVAFSGRLIRCDGLLRTVYATEGSLHSSDVASSGAGS